MIEEKTVIIFGEAGTGKSSTLNLITESDQAHVSNRTCGITVIPQYLRTNGYRVFDTPGLSEGNEGLVKREEARSELKTLIDKLSKKSKKNNGVHLIIMVMRKEKVNANAAAAYKTFVKELCQNKVPVLLFITHCDFDVQKSLGEWWEANDAYFRMKGVTPTAVVMGCAGDPYDFDETLKDKIMARREATMKQLFKEMDNVSLDLDKGWTQESSFPSFIKVVTFILVLLAILVSLGKK